MVSDGDMACDSGVVGENGVVANMALVGDVGVAKEKVVVSDLSGSVGGGPAMNGDVFSKGVIVPNEQLGLLALVFQVLSSSSKGGKGISIATLTDDGVTLDDDMTAQARIGSESNVISDDAIRSDLAIGADFSF